MSSLARAPWVGKELELELELELKMDALTSLADLAISAKAGTDMVRIGEDELGINRRWRDESEALRKRGWRPDVRKGVFGLLGKRGRKGSSS